ncbi:MAG: DUF1385 domain-containing protein [Chloroflexi bacterium]|nr:DUF1385 domain-containing protein [Chloroflexota bacterium]
MGKFHYGGQAVMEGVMIRGQKEAAVAVRAPDGSIVLHGEELKSAIYTSKITKLPFIRGLAMLWDMLGLGMRSMIFSANVGLMDEKTDDGKEVKLEGPFVWITVALSLLFGIALFFVAPLVIIGIADRYISSSVLSNFVEGMIRLTFLTAYLGGIGFLPGIGRVFAFHGAEHKTIHAYEAGVPLEPEAVRDYGTAHPRCGTGFLLVVVMVSILVFALFGRPPMIIRVISRILLVPVIAAVSYEFIKLTAAHYGNRLVRIITAPTMALQALTTRKPDDSMLEVAIAALKKALAADGLLEPAEKWEDDKGPVVTPAEVAGIPVLKMR